MMLLLLFKVGARSYAIESRRVVQIVPSTALNDESGWQHGVQVGLLRWQRSQTGSQVELVPVVDLAKVLSDGTSPKTIGTRIMVVQDEDDHFWGLMAGSVVQTWTIDDDLWIMSDSQCLLRQDQTLIYGLSVDQLLTEVRNSCDQFRVRAMAVE